MDVVRAYPLYLSWIAFVMSIGCGDPVDEPDPPDDEETGQIDVEFDEPSGRVAKAFDCDAVSAATVVDVEPEGLAPERATVEVDTVVEWRNHRDSPVTVTSGDETHSGSSFDSGDIPPRDSHCFEFRMTGSFHYYDRHHGSDDLSGVVRVDPEWR